MSTKSYPEILTELFDREAELRPLADEYLLVADAITRIARSHEGVPEAAPEAKPVTKRKPAAKPAGTRAPRGANKTALLVAITERPGATPGELAEATGIAKPVVYAALNQLVKRGEARKVELPAGGSGYALPLTEAA